MKQFIFTLFAVCALTTVYAKHDTYTVDNGGSVKVGAPKCDVSRKPTRAQITDVDPRQVNMPSQSFFTWQNQYTYVKIKCDYCKIKEVIMPKYRKKPAEFYAEINIPAEVAKHPKMSDKYYLFTRQGNFYLTDGDYIVTDENGYKLVYSNEDFLNTFEVVE